MADGYFANGITPEDTFPYGFPLQRKKLIVAPTGVCDPTMADTRERLVPYRAATAFFTGTIAGAASPIVFPSTSVLLFNAGPGDPAASAGGGTGTLRRSDTNAQAASGGGGVVRANQAFVMTGLWFQFLQPWAITAGGDPTGTRNGAVFLRSPVSPYDKIIQQLQGPVLNPGLKNGKDSACEFDLFSVDSWPSAGGMADAKIGLGGVGPSFLHLAVPEVSGGQSSAMELQLTLTQDRIVSIESDASNPTPAGLSVVSAIRCIVVGYPICATPGAVQIDYDQLAAALIRNGKGLSPSGSYDEALLKEAIARQAGRHG